MRIDLDDIEAKAKAATPGPWHVGGYGGQCKLDHGRGPAGHGKGDCDYRLYHCDDNNTITVAFDEGGPMRSDLTVVGTWDWEEGGVKKEEDAAHIAATNPAVVLALVAELRAARATIEKARLLDKSLQISHWGYSGTESYSQEHDDLRTALAAYDAATGGSK